MEEIRLKLMEILNITPANYHEVLEKEKEKEIEKVRLKENSEGMVLYYLNKSNETIGLLKLKTNWYIFLRALREKLSFYFNNKNKENIDIIQKINKRYNEIQLWLSLTNKQVNEWKNVAEQFTNWMNCQQQLAIPIRAVDIKSKFPIFWKEFFSSTFFQ